MGGGGGDGRRQRRCRLRPSPPYERGPLRRCPWIERAAGLGTGGKPGRGRRRGVGRARPRRFRRAAGRGRWVGRRDAGRLHARRTRGHGLDAHDRRRRARGGPQRGLDGRRRSRTAARPRAPAARTGRRAQRQGGEMTDGVAAGGDEPFPDKWPRASQTEIVERYHSEIRKLVAERFATSGKAWEEVVHDPAFEFTREDFEKIEADLLTTGYRFEVSARVALQEEPEKYKPLAAAPDSGEARYDDQGRQIV